MSAGHICRTAFCLVQGPSGIHRFFDCVYTLPPPRVDMYDIYNITYIDSISHTFTCIQPINVIPKYIIDGYQHTKRVIQYHIYIPRREQVEKKSARQRDTYDISYT